MCNKHVVMRNEQEEVAPTCNRERKPPDHSPNTFLPPPRERKSRLNGSRPDTHLQTLYQCQKVDQTPGGMTIAGRSGLSFIHWRARHQINSTMKKLPTWCTLSKELPDLILAHCSSNLRTSFKIAHGACARKAKKKCPLPQCCKTPDFSTRSPMPMRRLGRHAKGNAARKS